MIRKLFQALACTAGLILAVAPGVAQTAGTATAKAHKGSKASAKVAPSSAVDLNTASASELESVPGIGAPTAKKIIARRPYSSVADLSKAGISAASIKKISPMVTAGAGGGTTSAPPASSPAPAANPAKAAPMTNSNSSSGGTAKTRTPPTPAANAAPGGGPGMVWVNTETKVFHEQGDRWYGKTANGKYMKESDAMAAGYRAAKKNAAKKK